MKRAEAPLHALPERRRHLGAATAILQLGESLMAEIPDHEGVKHGLTAHIKPSLTYRGPPLRFRRIALLLIRCRYSERSGFG
jgi:hypothetical protein